MNIIRIVVACRDFIYIIFAAVDRHSTDTVFLSIARLLASAPKTIITMRVIWHVYTCIMDLVARIISANYFIRTALCISATNSRSTHVIIRAPQAIVAACAVSLVSRLTGINPLRFRHAVITINRRRNTTNIISIFLFQLFFFSANSGAHPLFICCVIPPIK
jgi:hypothetical protein